MRLRDVPSMRAFAFALAISLAASAASAAPPRRVASLKLCTDELLIALADPGQIVSVTFLSQKPAETPFWRSARHYRRNDGSLLSVAALKPDLVIDMGGGGRDSARIARRIGARVLILPYPQGIADLERSIRTLAAALGRPAAGARLLARIEMLKRTAPGRKIDSVWLGGGGRSLSAEGLGADWMALAGLRQRALAGDRMTLEQLLADPPTVLLRSDYRAGQYSADQGWLAHPLARRSQAGQVIRTDGRRWTCMGPAMPDEILRLRARLGR